MLKLSMPKFFATLWESLSIESREEVLEADMNQDPNMLWTIIRETHLTAIHGVGLGPFEIVQMKNKFNQLRQKPGTSIGEFKKEFDVQYKAICGAGVPATEAPELIYERYKQCNGLVIRHDRVAFTQQRTATQLLLYTIIIFVCVLCVKAS